MFFRILKQSFLQNKKQKFLAIITIALCSSLVTALLNTSIDVGDKMTSELKAYGANISVIPKSESLSLKIGNIEYNPLRGKVFLQEEELKNIKDIFWRNNVVGFAPFLKKEIQTDKGEKYFLEGTYFNKNVKVPEEENYKTGVINIFEYWEIQGLWPKDDSNEMLIGKILNEKLKLKIGDKISLFYKNKKKEFLISGILNSGTQKDNYFLTSLNKAQELFSLKGKVSEISVSVLSVPEDDLSRKSRRNPDALDSLEYDSWYCTAYVSSIAYQIQEGLTNAAVKPIWQVAASEGVIIKKIQVLMFVVTLAALFASAMGISALMSTTIMKRSKEIALSKALGSSINGIYLQFLSEAVIIGIMGGIMGFVFGCFLSQIISYSIFNSFVNIQSIVFPVILFSSVLISLLGSIIPCSMISKLLPIEVLYGRK